MLPTKVFCGCGTLKTGTRCIAILSMMWWSLMIVLLLTACITIAVLFPSTTNCNPRYQECYNISMPNAGSAMWIFVTIFVAGTGTCCFHIYVAYLLLRGLNEGCQDLLLPWITMTCFWLVTETCTIPYLITIIFIAGAFSLLIPLAILTMLILLVFHFVCVVSSFRKEMNAYSIAVDKKEINDF